MNKKSHIKIGILLVAGLCTCICAGCSAQQKNTYTAEELGNLAEIRIYTAENHELVKTINDEELLYQYNQCSVFDDSDIEERQDELKRDIEGTKEQYYLVSYKYPAARFGSKELEENYTITLYEDTNIIKMTVAEESIKAFSVPEEFLIFYYELTDEEINFYRSLTESGAVSKEGETSGQEDAKAAQAPATEQESESESEPEITEITISAVGDVTLGINQKTSYANSFDEYYDTNGADYFLQNVRPIFEEDDFTIVNLEGPLTNSDNIRTTKEWNHRGRPEYVSILTGSSVEAVSLGNNHIMDYQSDGVADTIQTVGDAGLAYALDGIWGNHLGWYETKGIQIGFVSVNEYYDGNSVYPYLEDGLAALREQGADLVFACLHWGGDKVHELEPEQYEMGRWCIDQGYDLVIGCHPHVIQGIECYNGKYIVYSMGNFCYGGSKNPADKDSMIFQQTFTFADGQLQEETSIRVIPCRLSSATDYNDYCPVLLEGEEAKTWAEHLNTYSAEFGLVFDSEGYLISQ